MTQVQVSDFCFFHNNKLALARSRSGMLLSLSYGTLAGAAGTLRLLSGSAQARPLHPAHPALERKTETICCEALGQWLDFRHQPANRKGRNVPL